VVDSDKYADHLEEKVFKSLDVLRKSEDHSMLNDSLQHVPTKQEIRAIEDSESALKMVSRIVALKELHHDDDINMFHHLEDMEHVALAHAAHLESLEGKHYREAEEANNVER